MSTLAALGESLLRAKIMGAEEMGESRADGNVFAS
jgi:hypothetical protein